ncbi:hypothetical protein [Mycolicibacterium mageritense]|uniref:hypothetical protein n=1 Tax=Mycolicibacterium mageritense TaxID=53462 RepID=UPI001E6205F2|nr:hypothetical protein [Mycolicibacterium mageritense]MCC9182596.1 hypothetical protein [Mycolicibacterium mageritense]
MGRLADQEISPHNDSVQRTPDEASTSGGREVIRAMCILVGAAASGSALAGLYLGTATVFGVGLAVAVAAGLGADLVGER